VHLITLTTDFGASDWFVGAMKGMILSFNRRAAVVDITHELAAGDIRGGAFALAASYRFFPKGSVHVAVVDPGVGGPRRAIAIQTADYIFVGPDNGVLSWALLREKVQRAVVLENPRWFAKSVSRTFHGRDIFAPVAAFLSRGGRIQELGGAIADPVQLRWPKSRRAGSGVEGEIVYVDRFGNLITNLEAAVVSELGEADRVVRSGRRRLCRVGNYYGEAATGQAVAVIGSTGFLEIAVNGGSAARKLGLRVGDNVRVQQSARRDRR